MKIQWFVLLLGIMLCAASSCKSKQKMLKADVEETGTNKVDEMDRMPIFSGGSCQLWVAKNVIYPLEAMKHGIQGKVYVQFIIDEQGKVVEPKVVKGSGSYLLDAAAVEVVSKMPEWKPGIQKGEIVKVSYTIPVIFALS